MRIRRVVFVSFALLLALPLAAETATYLAIIMPTPATANREQPKTFTVRALNSLQQPIPGYRGTVTFTPGDPSVEVPAPYTFTEADAGEHTFTVTFHRGYLHSFSVSDGTASESKEVLVLCPEISVTATNDGPVCLGQSATLTASTNATQPTFSWNRSKSGGAPPIEGQTVVLPPSVSSGTWIVMMSDAATGCLANASTNVTLQQGPDIFAPEAAGGDFTASITNNVASDPWTDIFWTVDFGRILSGQGTLSITIRPDPGVTVVYAQATATRPSTACRILSHASSTIIREAPPSEISSDASICRGAMERSASVPDAGPGATYSWSISSGGFIVMGQNLRTVVYNAPTDGSSVTLTVTVTKNAVSSTSSKTIPFNVISATVTGGSTTICAGESVTIPVSLAGTAPFSIAWSDGLVQSNINALATSRTVSPTELTTYAITSVSDASCTGSASGDATIDVTQPPQITQQPRSQTVAQGERATLSVTATGNNLLYEWFELLADGTSQRVASGASSIFITPPVAKTTTYFVKVSSECGAVTSTHAVISNTSRRRSVRH